MKFVVRFLLYFQILVISCTPKEDSELPEHIRDLSNLTVISTERVSLHTIHLEREMKFGSSSDLLIGELGSFTVDETNRLYIGDTQQHRVTIFDSTGKYITSLGRQGRGPGEFQFVGKLTIVDDFLYVYDPPQYRLNIFSSENLDFHETIPVSARNKRDFKELNEYEIGRMYPVSKSRFFGVFSNLYVMPDPSHPEYNLNSRFRYFYLLDKNGMIISDKIFKVPSMRALAATVNGEYRFTLFEFLGQTLFTVSDYKVYTARTEEFLIDVYNEDGEHLRAIYYPYQKRKFTREEAIIKQQREYEEGVIEWRVSVIEHAPEELIPDTWPALNDLVVDNENRIWVSTIVEDFDIYEWWVLDESGELITKFEWPRDEPIEVIKNGYMYTRETDEVTGLQQVVRYRIEIGEE